MRCWEGITGPAPGRGVDGPRLSFWTTVKAAQTTMLRKIRRFHFHFILLKASFFLPSVSNESLVLLIEMYYYLLDAYYIDQRKLCRSHIKFASIHHADMHCSRVIRKSDELLRLLLLGWDSGSSADRNESRLNKSSIKISNRAYATEFLKNITLEMRTSQD